MKNIFFGSGVSSSKDYNNLYLLIRTCIECGIECFDTAPSYGTESTIGNVLNALIHDMDLKRTDFFIQTKIDPWQMQEGSIESYVEDALSKLQVQYLDSLLIHWPEPDYLADTWNKMIHLQQYGLVKRIGICNVRVRQLREMLQKEVIPQIVQIERNPLRICSEEIALCQKHQIEVQAYSPLCKMDPRIRNNPILYSIAQKYGKNIGQIVLRWHLDTGVIPIFTSKKQTRIKDYAEIFDFCLNQEEIDCISALNENFKMYLESCICPGF